MMRVLCMLLAVLLCAAALPVEATAEELTGMTATEIVAQMRIGWNMGNTFDATGGDPADVYSQEQSWGNPIVDEALIQRVKDAGFNTIRIPVTWYRHVAEDGSYTINPAFMARIKEVVDLAYDRGLYVILNMHHEAWLNTATMDKDYEQIGVQLAAMWKQIADTFADYDQHLIFESMNEPRMAGTGAEWTGNKAGCDAVNYLNQVFVDVIRTDAKGNNGQRALMIPGYAASSSTTLMAAIDMPVWNGTQAENIIISVHCYNPYDFCLSDKMVVFDRSNKQHTSSIDTVFSNIQRLFLDKEIPVIMGETGATNTANNTEARESWAYHVGAKAAAYGVPICIWDNGNNNTSGGECHAWVRRSQNVKLRSQKNPLPFPTVVEALFEGASSIEWGTGREARAAAKSMLNGTLLWSNSEGLTIGGSNGVSVSSKAEWYAAGRQFAVVYSGDGKPRLAFTAADGNVIGVDSDMTNPMGDKKVAWFSYNTMVKACSAAGATDPAQLSKLQILTDSSAVVYELCYVGK